MALGEPGRAIIHSRLYRMTPTSTVLILLWTRAPSTAPTIQKRRLTSSGSIPNTLVGKRKLELPRLSAYDPKSCSSTSSDTFPAGDSF